MCGTILSFFCMFSYSFLIVRTSASNSPSTAWLRSHMLSMKLAHSDMRASRFPSRGFVFTSCSSLEEIRWQISVVAFTERMKHIVSLTLMLLVAKSANTKMMQKNWKITETLAHGYLSESAQQELSNGYQVSLRVFHQSLTPVSMKTQTAFSLTHSYLKIYLLSVIWTCHTFKYNFGMKQIWKTVHQIFLK